MLELTLWSVNLVNVDDGFKSLNPSDAGIDSLILKPTKWTGIT